MSIRSFYDQGSSYRCNTDIFLDKIERDERFARVALAATSDSEVCIATRGAALRDLSAGDFELSQSEAEQLVQAFDAAIDATHHDRSHPHTPDLAS